MAFCPIEFLGETPTSGFTGGEEHAARDTAVDLITRLHLQRIRQVAGTGQEEHTRI